MENSSKMSYIINHSKIVSQITMEEAVAEIRSDKHKEKTAQIRQLSSAGETEGANRLKGTLPGCTPAGTFLGRRKAECISEYASRIVLDVDGVKPEQFDEICRKIEADKHTHVRYASPKRGVKIIVCGEPLVLDDSAALTQQEKTAVINEYHLRLFRSLVPYYEALIGVKIDTSGSDLPRITYLCHDPEAYYNPDSVFFPLSASAPEAGAHSGKRGKGARGTGKTHTGDFPVERNKGKSELTKKSCSMLFRVLEMQLQRSKSYEPGNRNNFLFTLACKCNEAGIPEDALFNLMANSYDDIATQELESIIGSAYGNTENHGIHPLTRQAIRVLFAQCYLKEKYEFRFNEIKGILEYCPNKPDAVFEAVDDRIRNSLWVELAEHGSECSAEQLYSILNSDFSPSYNPLKEYFLNLPAWNGKDNIRAFASQVRTTRQDHWFYCFEKWICAMVAAVVKPNVQNHTVVILEGPQSQGKTTFVRSILPPALRDYYCEDRINTESKDDMIKVFQSLLINTEEIEAMNGRELNQYKALITRATMNIRLPYDRIMQVRKRMASFIATTNNHDILTDRTGNRRYLCFEALSFDNNSAVDYEQLYAHVMHKLMVEEFRYWFTREESVKVNKHNQSFMQQTLEEEFIATNIRKPLTGDKISYITASQIAILIKTRTGLVLNHGGKVNIGRILNDQDYERIPAKGGVYKYVVHVISYEEVMLNLHIKDEVEKEPDATQQELNYNTPEN
ncbi:VirE N-terminal domain-containing protein [Bacteroides luti]|uniref:VirE N-terminal domain-containing protein n=1 Tax=Bacteroides luti TaxID=1297750 RepID=A0A1M4WF05_9BACE|nr:VapE domain-containing protein [Bacteroides luti]SHE79839.1 VirE N-terminal domain-containing protein [Bacteroides luti]